MIDEVVTISKFKATCLAVIDRVKRTGRPILITRRGEAIATITPPPEPQKSEHWLGTFESTGKIVGDIITPVMDECDWETLNQ